MKGDYDEKKLWGGRFDGKNEHWIDEFGASIQVDQKLADQDIAGSLAHVKMLGETRILTADEVNQITTGLKQVQEKKFIKVCLNSQLKMKIFT